MENRIPNVIIRKRLRKEVNYGCPICRSPFLAYHHFDPPWEPNHIHNLEGMIALCPLHHAQADVGTWTNQELRNMKKDKLEKSINGQIHWSLGQSVIVAGSNLFLGNNISFRLLGREIFKIKEIRPKTVVLNALLFNEKDQPILQILEDDIIIAPELVDDFNCTASANRIRVDVKESNSFFEMNYSRRSLDYIIGLLDDELQRSGDVISLINQKLVEDKISLIEIKFCINTSHINLECRVPDIVFDFRKSGQDRASLYGKFFGTSGCLSINFHDVKTGTNIEYVSLGNNLR